MIYLWLLAAFISNIIFNVTSYPVSLQFTSMLMMTYRSRMREGQFEDSAESERRALLVKKWSSYKFKQNTQQLRSITAAIVSQERALQELKFESEELYQEAVKVNYSNV